MVTEDTVDLVAVEPWCWAPAQTISITTARSRWYQVMANPGAVYMSL